MRLAHGARGIFEYGIKKGKGTVFRVFVVFPKILNPATRNKELMACCPQLES